MNLAERSSIVEAARHGTSERYTGPSTTVGKIENHPIAEFIERIKSPVQKAGINGPSKRDKSQLIAMIAVAEPATGVFDPRVVSGDLGAISRNASSQLYALNENGQPFVTEKGFQLAAIELSISTGNDLQSEFRRRLEDIPETERIVEVKKRVGQDVLRADLLRIRCRCQVTGLGNPLLLRASHIRPWSESDQDRLNPENALLLAIHIDACFDALLISFGTSGEILISSKLTADDQKLLGIAPTMKLDGNEKHQAFLSEHRKRYSAAGLCM